MAREATSPGGNGSSPVATGCALLVRPGHEPPKALIEGLRQRGARTFTISDLPAVMVTLAQQPVNVLVVTDAPHWHALPQLIAAVRRYHPRVRLWRFEWDATQRKARLSRLTNGMPNRDAAAAVEKKSGEPRAPAPRPMAEPLITQEELAMLIGPSPT